MSDKLSDERREHLEFIERCDPTFLIMHLGNRTAFDADALESVFQLAKERARELLAASPAPAISESEDARDAARYRFLRGDIDRPPNQFGVYSDGWLNAPDLDEKLDAARKGGKS